MALMAGILAGSISPDDKTFFFPIIFLLSFLICLFLYLYKKFIFLFFLGLVFCCGYLSIQIKLSSDLPLHHISNYLDTKKMKMSGRVISFKKHYKRKYSLIILLHAIEIKKNTSKKVTGRIILNIYGRAKTIPEFGDMILFESTVRSIKNFKNPGAFDYKRFLKLKGIWGTAYSDPKKIKILTQTDQINGFLKLIRK